MNNSSEKIALGCDHAAYQLKEQVKAHLEAMGLELKDFGTFDESSVDYPDYAFFVGKAVVSGECSRGIVLCGTGIGISMAANKVKGIRAAVCTNAHCAEMTRRHNNANILCMGGQVIDKETALQLVDIFLDTGFDGGRHARRIAQIAQIEEGTL